MYVYKFHAKILRRLSLWLWVMPNLFKLNEVREKRILIGLSKWKVFNEPSNFQITYCESVLEYIC